jgi:repressor LexA
MNKLTDRQRMVLEYICESIQDRGYPPTLREIGLKLGIRSTNGVNDHLRALERKGYLTREDMKSRTLRPTEITLRLVGAGGALRGGGTEVDRVRQAEAANDDLVEVPILGRVAAGVPIEAIEQHCDTVRIDRVLLGTGTRSRDIFGLRIQGDSMIEAGIHDGDYVFVRKQPEAPRGAIVVAIVGDEATCKYFYPEVHHVRLQPANASMAPILIPKTDWRETMILGVVIGVFRRL